REGRPDRHVVHRQSSVGRPKQGMPFGPAHAGAVTARAARALQSGSMHQAHEGGPPFTTGRCLAMIIPHHMLSPEALHSVIEAWLLLDSRVVDVLMAYNPTFVILSSLKSLSFNSLKN